MPQMNVDDPSLHDVAIADMQQSSSEAYALHGSEPHESEERQWLMQLLVGTSQVHVNTSEVFSLPQHGTS
jgi:hypothetical protein